MYLFCVVQRLLEPPRGCVLLQTCVTLFSTGPVTATLRVMDCSSPIRTSPQSRNLLLHPCAFADREIQRTLMELLAQLDGFENLGQVKIVMATNRPDILDPALLR